MIVFRYIGREIFQAFISITTILLIVFLSQALIRYMGDASSGRYPADFILAMLAIETPHLLVILMPLGMFVGIILVLSRMYADNEMTILFSSGLSRSKLCVYVLIYASVVFLLVSYMSLILEPEVYLKRNQLREKARASNLLTMLIPGQFFSFTGGKKVIHIKEQKDDKLVAEHVFLAQKKINKQNNSIHAWDIVIAKSSKLHVEQESMQQYALLEDGYRYVGMPGKLDYRIVKFDKYGVLVPKIEPQHTNEIRELSTLDLLGNHENKQMNAELHWRIALPVSVFILALLAVVCSNVKPRAGRYAKLIPALLLYIVYVNLLLLGKNWIRLGLVNSYIGLWWLPVSYLILIFCLFNIDKIKNRFNHFVLGVN